MAHMILSIDKANLLKSNLLKLAFHFAMRSYQISVGHNKLNESVQPWFLYAWNGIGNAILPIFSEVTHLTRFVFTLSMIFSTWRGSKLDKNASRSSSKFVAFVSSSWKWRRSCIEPEIQTPTISFKYLHALFSVFFLLVIDCSIIISFSTVLVSTRSLVRLFKT